MISNDKWFLTLQLLVHGVLHYRIDILTSEEFIKNLEYFHLGLGTELIEGQHN